MKHFVNRWAALFCVLLCMLLAVSLSAAETRIATLESDTTRVMLLSDAVIRVEQKGDHGFEDRVSLIAAGRGDFTGVAAKTRTEGNCLVAETATYTVRLYTDRGYHADAVEIFNADGKLVWTCPNCGNTDQSKMNVARRTCGYIGTQFWNQGRTQEIKERVLHL